MADAGGHERGRGKGRATTRSGNRRKMLMGANVRSWVASLMASATLAGCTVHATTTTASAPPPPPPAAEAPPQPPPAPAPPPPPPAPVAVAPAPPPPHAHPAYLHALSDLRNARANLERRG